MVTTRAALRAVEADTGRCGLQVDRYFTTQGVHPYDELDWVLRDAVIKDWRTGKPSFEQRDVEFPSTWSMNATTIVAQKYFRGTLGTPERESSVKHMIDRVADAITRWGTTDGYFADDASAEVFNHELKHLLVNQKTAFNSPVWFNCGVEPTPQCSACQPYDALVSTPDGLVPIGELVESGAVGAKVYDAHGLTKVVAVKRNGRKRVLRLHLHSGQHLDVTPDHLVWRADSRGRGRFVQAGDLRSGDRLEWHRVGSEGSGEITREALAEAALAGWLQADGFVGEHQGANRSLTIEATTVTDAELRWVTDALDVVFPDTHRHERSVATQDTALDCRRTRLHGRGLEGFVQRWELRTRGVDMQVPQSLYTAPLPVVRAYLRSLFQAEGYVTVGERSASIGFDMISEQVVRGVQALLLRFGIFSRVSRKSDPRPDRKGCWFLSIGNLGDRASFHSEIGFIDPRKADTLGRSLALEGKASAPVKQPRIARVSDRGVMDVYDIQTESGEYLSGNLRVHNCFILSVEDTMSSILNWYVEEGTIFKGGSGSGVNLSRIRSSKERLKGGGEASGPVSFMRGADASAGTIKSGGKTRRAAKMVILDVDHPDIEEFIWCKQREEAKVRALREAGFDMDLDGADYASIQYQNANNSVRVNDEFMRAVVDGGDFDLVGVTDGEVKQTRPARDLMRQIAEAAWECADPGVQYDTTINDWHTTPNAGRINGSNPCFTGDTLVDTADGAVPIEVLAKDFAAGNQLPEVLTYDLASGRWRSARVLRAWETKRTTELVEVTTAGGVALRCTPDHRFMTASGEWLPAAELVVGQRLRAADGESRTVEDTVLAVRPAASTEPVPVYDLTVEDTHNFAVAAALGSSVCVHNCSEYMHLDNSACNLASLNLRKFESGGVFDTEAFTRAVEITFTAQEIIVGNSSYPTPKIAENARAYRQLGLGYANLGGLLMSQGLAYDCEEGRAWAAAITALMTGHAYRTSAELARVQGPFDGYAADRDGTLRVIAKHRDAVETIDADLAPAALLDAARASWDDALELGAQHGIRNAQASVLAPTGTISFLLDCDTTGIEPDLGLVKMKKMVGGGSMKIVNQTVPVALKRLGYQSEQVEAIVAYIDQHSTIEGAPALRDEHLPVFDCAMGERSISAMGHVQMMAAVQPFISGAISKCVVGDTLLPTEDGLVRIASLHQGEQADTFRDEIMAVASLGGTQKTDAFYFGGSRRVRRVRLRSGHTVTGTENHRLMVATDDGPVWRYLDEIQSGEYVAVRYGADLWAAAPPRLDDYAPVPPYGSQKRVKLPTEMTSELAFLLGAYASEGHVSRSNWTIVISNAVDEVLERVKGAWAGEFGVEAQIVRQDGKCPGVVVASRSIVEFLDHLGCGRRASAKRIPDVVLRSPRDMVLAFLQGLWLDAYASVSHMPKVAICLDSPQLLDDLQAVLTNLGVVHGRIAKYNARYDKTFDEVYATGAYAGRLARLVPFMEPEKAARARRLTEAVSPHATADVVPGITGRELYDLVPRGRSSRSGSTGSRSKWRFLVDPRTRHVSRGTLVRLSEEGIELPAWLQSVLDDDLHFSPVASVEDAGVRDVYDVSVPTTHAFVGNGIVNHNTVNVPESASVDDVEEMYIEGWRLGLKAVAIYRDNCKVAQPLSIDKRKAEPAEPAATLPEAQSHGVIRRRLPKMRPSQTLSFQVGDAEGYLTAGEYPSDGLGEIFVKLGKQGSTLSGVMDAFAIAVSVGLQYGVPLEEYVKKFTNMRFEPAGMTDDAEVKFASSIVDYLFRRLAIEYLPIDRRQTLGIYTLAERQAQLDAQYGAPAAAPAAEPAEAEPQADAEGQTVLPVERHGPVDDLYGDAPMCYACGVKMQRAGSCHVCSACGATSGCS
jgi:ribonucleotide reductase alpha subunit